MAFVLSIRDQFKILMVCYAGFSRAEASTRGSGAGHLVQVVSDVPDHLRAAGWTKSAATDDLWVCPECQRAADIAIAAASVVVRPVETKVKERA